MITKIEKERRWLLKRFPKELSKKNCIHITQKYVDKYRIRKTIDKNGNVTYEQIEKTSISKGVNEEKHYLVDETTYRYLHDDCPTVSKKRYTLVVSEDLIIEIDVFESVSLIIMEVENVDLDDKIEFPIFIDDCILMEITGLDQFSNRALSI